MKIVLTPLEGVVIFEPTVHRDERGFFTRTFDHDVAAAAGIDGTRFVQDSQSRSRYAVIRGLHGRGGEGEAKLVRCARGAIHEVVLDARATSPTFGEIFELGLDDVEHKILHLPRGIVHGWQALSDEADVCYRIDARHDPQHDLAIAHDDPDLRIQWPLPFADLSARDRAAPSWRHVRDLLLAGGG